jgi:hypothetical protein
MSKLENSSSPLINEILEKGHSKPVHERKDELGRLLLYLVLIVVGITIVMAAVVYFAALCSELHAVLSFFSVAIGCIAFGAAIGFLFGIPRAQKESVSASGHDTDVMPDERRINGYYNDNTNLEEISDWLTKIILGLTLVELKSIVTQVSASATLFSSALGGTCCEACVEDYYVFGYAIMVFYFISGSGLVYLWTRSNLLSILEQRRRNRLILKNQKLSEEKEKLSEEKEKLSEEKENISERKDKLYDKLSRINRESNDKLRGIQHDGERERYVNTNVVPFEEGDQSKKFKNEVMRMYRQMEIKHPDDLQKGRWGGENLKGNVGLFARYNPEAGDNGFYGIDLKVESLNGESIGPEVAFFLHDTFPDEIEFVNVVENKAF